MGRPPGGAQSRPARTFVLIFIWLLESDPDDVWVRRAAVAAGTNLGLDLHGGSLESDEDDVGGRAAAAVATGTNLGLDLHRVMISSGGGPPQSRPARTLVLIFMMDSRRRARRSRGRHEPWS